MNESELENMIVRLTGDGSSFQKMLDSAQKQAQEGAKSIGDASKKIEGFEKGLEGFAKTALGILGNLGLVTSFTGAFDKFVNIERDTVRLNSAIEATGRNVKEVTADYAAYAEQISSVALITKGEVRTFLQQAEAMGLQGEAAKNAVTNAVALGAASKQGTAASMHAAIALEKGNLYAVKHLLGLHNITNATELYAQVQKKLELGFKTAQNEANTTYGKIETLKIGLAGLNKDIGFLIAEAVVPVIDWLTKLVNAFQNLSPETKKMIVQIVAATLALLAIGPAIAILRPLLASLFAPLLSVIPVVISILGALLSPIGLIVAAVVAMGAAILYWTGAGGDILDWFGKKWSELKEFVKPAIDGIKDAISAGDLQLAFEIAWVQIKLTFLKATEGLRAAWYDFTYFFKQLWINTVAEVQTAWEGATDSIATGIINTGNFLHIFNDQEAEDMKRFINEDAIRSQHQIDRERKSGLDRAREDNKAALRDIQKGLDDLQKERDRLVAKAAAEASKAAKEIEIKPKIGKIPHQTVHAHLKFDAVAFESAEAASRVQEYLDMLKLGGKEGEGAGKAEGGKAVLPAPIVQPVPATPPSSEPWKPAETVQLLKDIRDAIKEKARGVALDIQLAQLQQP